MQRQGELYFVFMDFCPVENFNENNAFSLRSYVQRIPTSSHHYVEISVNGCRETHCSIMKATREVHKVY